MHRLDGLQPEELYRHPTIEVTYADGRTEKIEAP
jgi:hypothetical protein